MKTKTVLILLFIGMLGIAAATPKNDVIVDTLYAVLPLTNSIFHNMLTDAYMYYPNYTSLDIHYGRSAYLDPGILEGRSVVTFLTVSVPIGYHIQRAEISLYCEWYLNNSEAWIWPYYYSTPYHVMIDHMQFDSILPAVFGQTALTSDIAVVQDSAYIGWIGTDVTNCYLDDLQQSRTYSQYRLHFPPGYDVTGFQGDLVQYGRLNWGTPRLVITYQQDVSNSDEVSPTVSSLVKRLYPLPARGVLNIELEDKHSKAASIYLYDLKGRLVYVYDKLNVHNDPVQLHLPDCSSGIYFLKVEAGQKSEVKRITIIQ